MNLLAALASTGCISMQDMQIMQTRLDGSWLTRQAEPEAELHYALESVGPVLTTHTRIVVRPALMLVHWHLGHSNGCTAMLCEPCACCRAAGCRSRAHV